jgi:hypothetical protein
LPVRRRTIELLADEMIEEQRGAEMVALLEESVATYERVDEASTDDAARAGELLALCKRQANEDSQAR